jgi:type IV pilus assembly protein PilQ
VRNRKQIITSIVMGSAVAALSSAAVNAAPQPVNQSKLAPSSDLIAQTPPPPPPPMVPNPNITIDGVTPVPGVGLATPTIPHAVAPPVGDISVSNLDASMPVIDLGSSARINMVLKNTPAREVLESLARSANLNLAYSDSSVGADGKPKTDATVTLNLRNEPVQNAFNYVLQLSGLEANRVGNTIFVGTRLPDSVRETIVRTLRMNQVTSSAAANFLTSQGAETQIATTKVSFQSVGEGAAARTVETRTPEILALKASESSSGTLLLRGLSVTTDERLNAITLVGSPRKVEMATSMLTRLDARRRQVAINVKIVDVNLSNSDSLNSSLSFKSGDTIFGVDQGVASVNFGNTQPGGSTLSVPAVAAINGISTGTNSRTTTNSSSGSPVTTTTSITTGGTVTGGTSTTTPGGNTTTTGGIVTGGTTNTNTSTTSGNNPITTSTNAITGINPTALSTFLSSIKAQIISGNGKILTDPTLVVQEGQKATVNLTQDVFGGFKINSVAGTGATTSTREPIIKQAGLSLDILVNRIDDNGFVSVGVTPTVSSIGSTLTTSDGDIALLQSRTMNSGEIRLRDGQTLILSGIIQESDRSSVTKIPILGDIPILGALFRSTTKSNQRQEVVVLLTPQILDDNKMQVKYAPGIDARMMIGK